MRLRALFGRIRREVWCSVYSRRIRLGERGPIVTFTFDDFPRSAFTRGTEILDKYGARGTYYVAMSLMNTTNKLGEQFRREDLGSLATSGHEIANHTFSHVSARAVDCDVFRQDVEKGNEEIRNAIGVSSGNFAYPYGAVTLAVKRQLGPQLKTCRGTCPGINGPDIDLNLLRANALYGRLDRIESAKRLIIQCQAARSWLIFYTHDVSDIPSHYGCTPELLEAACSFAADRGVRLLSIAQVSNELEQQLPYRSELTAMDMPPAH